MKMAFGSVHVIGVVWAQKNCQCNDNFLSGPKSNHHQGLF